MEKVKNKTQNETINDLGRADLLVTPTLNTFYNDDCMNWLPKCPPDFFELAIVDPPYGLGKDGGSMGFCGGMKRNGTTPLSLKGSKYKKKNWDSNTPNKKYFDELFRVSKNQIIWGVNYYKGIDLTGGRIFWDKDNGNSNFSDGELAYQSFTNTIRKFKWRWHGFFQEEMSLDKREIKIHPTQKPVGLYKLILNKYAKTGDKILDTHAGSASCLVACKELGFDYVGFEIDKEYWTIANERLGRACYQPELFGRSG